MSTKKAKPVVIKDRGAPAKALVKPKQPVKVQVKKPAPQALSNTQKKGAETLLVPKKPPVRAPIKPVVVKEKSPFSLTAAPGNLAGQAIANLVLRTHDTVQQAAKFLYNAAARQAENEDDVFAEIYTLGLAEYDSERAERQQLMAQLTGDEDISPYFVGVARQNLIYTNRRVAELRQGLNLSAAANQRNLTMAYTTMDSQDKEELLQAVLGYQIEFDGSSNESSRLEQLQNLATSSLYIIDFIDSVVSPESGSNNLELFTRYFTRSRPRVSSTATPVTVYLGAEDTPSESTFGLVPQPESSVENRNAIFLGSDVVVSTIVHEFGHQLDRWYKLSGDERFTDRGITGYLGDARPPDPSLLYETTRRYNLNADLMGSGLQGFAAKQLLRAEFMADLFMTAVLADRNEKVFSLDIDIFTSDERSQLEVALGGDSIQCENGRAIVTLNGQNREIPCGWQVVGWEDPTLGTQINMLFGGILGE